MSVYTTVFSASVPVGGLAMGAIASGFGASLAIGLGGVLSVAVGLAALAWGRQDGFAIPETAAVGIGGTVAGVSSARPR